MIPTQSLLVADDDREVRHGAAEFLGGCGLEVLEAESGHEALEIVRRRVVHLCLLDLHMPGCTGLEALHLIRSARAGLPCLVWSGHLTLELERLAMERGAFAVLRKPVPPALLREEVLRALASNAA